MPSTLGRYRVLGELGRGAMGAVLLAEDPLLKRGVAIKVALHPGAGGDALDRFRREAEISARLSHPNVVMVFDVGEEPGVGPYLAMEYVAGQSLAERLAAGAVAPDEVASLLVQATLALEASHEAGILHRDIKPANFMLSTEGRLKLMDFGIAREAEPGRTTGLLCTPVYAAPELLDGARPSRATDVWAFAVTAFQMVTGQLPFPGGSTAQVLNAIVHQEPVIPEGVSPEVAEVLRRALAKDPGCRFPDLRSFVMALLDALPLTAEAHLQARATLGVSLTLGAATPTPRLWRPWMTAAASAGAAVMLLGWLWLSGTLGTRRLSVTSNPAGAQVKVDGKVLGLTPVVDGAIPPFAKGIRLEREGHVPLEAALAREDRRLAFALVRLPISLQVVSEPEGAEVLVDGVKRGMTPLRVELLPGRHRLEVRKKGWETWTMSLDRDQRPPERIRLKKAEDKGGSSWAPRWLRNPFK